jgi:glycosyltransferase involved in cell wall biosynthesis
MAARKILFISHEAVRTGAPLVLLYFMRWLKSNSDYQSTLLLLEGGDLTEEFKQVAAVHLFDRREYQQRKMSLPIEPDLVYCNSVASALMGPRLTGGKWPSLCHVHELETTIQAILKVFPVRYPFDRFDRFIACAQVVKQNLVTNHRLDDRRIDVVHEFIPVDRFAPAASPQQHRWWLRQELGVDANALVIGCIGSPEWKKGADVFVHLAKTLMRRYPDTPVYLVWLGGMPNAVNLARFLHDLVRMPELNGRVFHFGNIADPLPFLAGFDLFVLPSREDPFPLVCLEAAACGKAIVCFDNAGGIPEFLQNDAGVIVPYMDIETMATTVMRLLRDPQSRQMLGDVGRQRVRAQHDISTAAPRILACIERVIGQGKT